MASTSAKWGRPIQDQNLNPNHKNSSRRNSGNDGIKAFSNQSPEDFDETADGFVSYVRDPPSVRSNKNNNATSQGKIQLPQMTNVHGKSMNKDLLKLEIKSDRLSRKGNSTARNYGSSDRD